MTEFDYDKNKEASASFLSFIRLLKRLKTKLRSLNI